MPESELTYHSHIDGLRAVAVVAVILFHLQIGLLPGGYLGVDVFFVISGFVISQSLYKDYVSNGRISFRHFYTKRLKRLYPALVTMVVITTIAYFFFGFLWDTNLYIKSAVTSIFATSNLYYLLHGNDYFTQGLVNPLLHTWSLGVEEQFYLLYPLLLSLSLVCIKKFRLDLWTVVVPLILLSAISCATFIFDANGIFGNFYSPVARFWELGIGCILFFFMQTRSHPKKIPLIVIVPLLLLFSVFFLQGKLFSLQTGTIFITVSTAAVIYLGMRTKDPILYVLQSKKINYLGKISYSLYLWHMPVIYFAGLYSYGVMFYIIALSVTVILAVVSYHLIENPLRYINYGHKSIRYIFYILVVAVLVSAIFFTHSAGLSSLKKDMNRNLILFGQKLASLNYIESHSNLGERISADFAISSNDTSVFCSTDAKTYSVDSAGMRNECFKHQDDGTLFFLNGDSHAQHYVPMLEHSSIVRNLYFRELSRTVITDIPQTNGDTKIISDRLAELRVLTNQFKKTYFIISLYLDQRQYDPVVIAKNLDSLIQEIEPNVNIIIVDPTPVFNSGPESCIVLNTHCSLSKEQDLQRSRVIRDLLERMGEKYQNVHVYNPYDALCPEALCIMYRKRDDLLLYRDSNHLSIEGSASLSHDFDLWLSRTYNLQ